MFDFLEELNPPQREAVTHNSGPLLILAGAGSGKTRVLTYRTAFLVSEKKIPAQNILGVTFTNKAAGEMKNRVENLLGLKSANLWLSTFHSLCAKILRAEANQIGYSKYFSIYDEDDQTNLIKECLEELGLTTQKFSPSAILNKISACKNVLIDWRTYPNYAYDFFEKNVSKVYELYQQKLEKANAFDFDDLIMKTVQLFEKNSKILDKCQNLWEHILVDEYQDTNKAQYVLVKLLSAKNKNLCVVGDDDQSIYGWRGADLNNILDFEKDFPDCKVIRLEQNYRSTNLILDAAWSVVKNNSSRKEKKLWTDKTGGEKLTVLACYDEKNEAWSVVEKIKELSGNYNYSGFVILYRTNAQSRVLEQALRDEGIPYTIVGGVRFYERKEIKDILAFLKILVNPNDGLGLKRVLKTFADGIGAKTISKIEEFGLQKNKTLLESLFEKELINSLPTKAKNSIMQIAKLIKELDEMKDKLPVNELTEKIIHETKYLDTLMFEKTEEAENRAENVKELISATTEFKERHPNPNLENFLEEVSLMTDFDRWDSSQEAVNLMTLHSAKGLEFPIVFICGLEEGLFPLSRSMDTLAELEEERRLF
ncbi:MAG: ATP-dependent DNA helicase PcrA, partial [candidate division Zixibacteria bacterium RBG_16_40_9]